MEYGLDTMRFGKGTVRENLARAVAAGSLSMSQDGAYVLSRGERSHNYLHVQSVVNMECGFKNDFLFRYAYDRMAVPYGCGACYKVKVVPQDLRGLVALRGILEKAPYHSKCGVDFFNPHSRDNYAGFLYLDGLAAARAAYRDLRDRVDAHSDLGSAIPLTIKRGCSNYEAACGPSNRWAFREGMPAIEESLKLRFHLVAAPVDDYRSRRIKSMMAWLQFAYSLKDDSYLVFTGGKPLHSATLSYQAVESTDESRTGSG